MMSNGAKLCNILLDIVHRIITGSIDVLDLSVERLSEPVTLDDFTLQYILTGNVKLNIVYHDKDIA
jgi:hypothetical protein